MVVPFFGEDMKAKLLLVDLENVRKINLGNLKSNYHVVVFVGSQQAKIKARLVSNAGNFDGLLEYVQIEGTGKNALDFYIACYLGQLLERQSQQKCIVLSKDKGFDPLIKYLNKNGLKCKRVGELVKCTSKGEVKIDADYKRVANILKKTNKNNLPKKQKTLLKAILAMYQNEISPQKAKQIVSALFDNKLISESSNRLSYTF